MRKIVIIIILFLVYLLPGNVSAAAFRDICHDYGSDQQTYHGTENFYTNTPLCKPLFSLFTGNPFFDGLTIAIALLVLLIFIYLYKKIIGSRINKILAKDNYHYLKKTVKKPN